MFQDLKQHMEKVDESSAYPSEGYSLLAKRAAFIIEREDDMLGLVVFIGVFLFLVLLTILLMVIQGATAVGIVAVGIKAIQRIANGPSTISLPSPPLSRKSKKLDLSDLEYLEKLADLKERGIISDEELSTMRNNKL